MNKYNTKVSLNVNPIQKYYCTLSCVYVLKIFVVFFLLAMNVLISFALCSTPKVSIYVILSPDTQ